MAGDAFKLALSGFRSSVEWWGLPTRLEWALDPDQGARVTKLGSQPHAWPAGVCVGLEAGIEDLLLRHGGQSPGRVPGVTPRGLLGVFSVRKTSWVSAACHGTP